MNVQEVKIAIKSLVKTHESYYKNIISQIEEAENPEAIYAKIGEGCKDITEIAIRLSSLYPAVF